MPGVPRRAGVGRGCRFQAGVHGAFSGVSPEKVVLRAPLVVVPFLLPPPLEGRVVCWELSLDELVVLLGVHGVGQGARYCGVDVLLGAGGGGGVVARSASCRWCSAFWSAVARWDMGGDGMGWLGSCGSVACWWACGRGALAASRCRMAGRTS